MTEPEKNLFKPGPFHGDRHEIVKRLLEVPIKTGDIFFRLDNYYFMGLPFSKIAADASKSKYDHAATALVEDEIYIVEVSDMGTQKVALIDWVDFCYSNEFSVYRLDSATEQEKVKLEKSIRDFLDTDPDYDLTFGRKPNNFYCTESVYKIFERAGIKLADPLLLKDIVSKKWAYFLIAGISDITYKLFDTGIPTDVPLHIVGNENWGLMSSKRLGHLIDVKIS